MVIQKKSSWQKECKRCGKEFIATGKSCKVCEGCNVGNSGVKSIRVDKGVKQELDKLIKDFGKPNRELNHNKIIKGYLKMTKLFSLKDKLKKIVRKKS